MTIRFLIVCFLVLLLPLDLPSSRANQPIKIAPNNIRLRPVAPIWKIFLTNPPTIQKIDLAQDSEFELSENHAIGFLSNSFRSYQIECDAGPSDAEIQISPWYSSASGYLFHHQATLREGRAIIRPGSNIGAPGSLLRSSTGKITGCKLRSIRPAHSPSSWIKTIEDLGVDYWYTAYKFNHIKIVDPLHAAKSNIWINEKDLSFEDLRAAKLAAAVWKTGPVRLIDITETQPIHPLYPENQARYLPDARYTESLTAGLYRVRFWPALQPGELVPKVCNQITIEKYPIHLDCWDTKPAVWDQPPPGGPDARNLTTQGNVIGRMDEFRISLADPHQTVFSWNRPGWISIQKAQPIWGWSRGWDQHRAVIIAYYKKPSLEINAEPTDAPTRLVSKLIDLKNAGLVGSAASREFYTRWYGQTKWVLSTPEPTSNIKELQRDYLVPKCDDSTSQIHKPATQGTVWTGVGPNGITIRSPEPDIKLLRLPVLIENLHTEQRLCFFKLAGQTFARPVDHNTKESHFLMPLNRAAGIVSLSKHCRLWIPEVFGKFSKNSHRDTRLKKRFYHLDPGRVLRFNLPVNQFSKMLQLRAFKAASSRNNESNLEIKSENSKFQAYLRETIQDPAGCFRAARMQFFVSAAESWIDLHNRSNHPVLVSLYLRGGKNTMQTTYRVLPPTEPVSKELHRIEALGNNRRLKTDLQSITRTLSQVTASSDWKSSVREKFDLLFDRIRVFIHLGQWSAARADLTLAQSINLIGQPAAKLEVLRNTYLHARNYLPALALLYGVFPLDPVIMPVAPEIHSMVKANENKSPKHPFHIENPPYLHAWSLWSQLHRDKLDVVRDFSKLVWLHAIAAEEKDWLMAAGVLEQILTHTDNLAIKTMWLRELARANRTGQILTPNMFLLALAQSEKLNRTLKGAASPLIDAFSIGSTWSTTSGFTGTAGRKKIRQNQEGGQKQLEFGWFEDWQESTYWRLGSGTNRAFSLTLPTKTKAAFEVRWRQQPMSTGSPPACILFIHLPSGKQISMRSPPTHLATKSAFSVPMELNPPRQDIFTRLHCDLQGSQTQAQLRMWTKKPVHPHTTKTHPSKYGFSYIVRSSPQTNWLLLKKNRTAELDILGPNLLRLRFRNDMPPNTRPRARIRLSAPFQKRRTSHLNINLSQLDTETILPLAKNGTWNVRLSSDRDIWFYGSHRSPCFPDNVWVSHVEKLLAQQSENITSHPMSNIQPIQSDFQSKESLLQSSYGSLGTIVLKWKTQTDSIEKDAGTFGDNWVYGPSIGWHHCLDQDACIMTDAFLRLRKTGKPTTSIMLKGLYELPFGLRFIPNASFSLQSIQNRIEHAYQASLELEQAFRLGGFLGIYPSVGFQKRDESLDCHTDEIADSEIHNTYQCLHHTSTSLQLRITARPFWESLFIGRVSLTSNPDLKPWTPDRTDMSIDGFFGFPGLIINPEAALSLRFLDEDRRQHIIRPYFGLHMTKSWWMSNNWLLLLSAGGRYFTDSTGYDAGIQISFSWSPGRAMQDYHSKWQPLKSFLQWHQPAMFVTERISPIRSED